MRLIGWICIFLTLAPHAGWAMNYDGEGESERSFRTAQTSPSNKSQASSTGKGKSKKNNQPIFETEMGSPGTGQNGASVAQIPPLMQITGGPTIYTPLGTSPTPPDKKTPNTDNLNRTRGGTFHPPLRSGRNHRATDIEQGEEISYEKLSEPSSRRTRYYVLGGALVVGTLIGYIIYHFVSHKK